MKSRFSLSFGYALVIVGILNIFFKTNYMVLIGLSISAFMFSIMNMLLSNVKNEKYEMLYIIPFIILLAFSCYSDSLVNNSFINWLEENDVSSILTFLSFGMLFIVEYKNLQKRNLEEIRSRLAVVAENVNYTELILNVISEYEKQLKKGSNRLNEDFLEKIRLICTNKIEKAKIELALLEAEQKKYLQNEKD